MSTMPIVPHSSKGPRGLISIEQLSPSDVRFLLANARSILEQGPPTLGGFSAGLIFLQPSLRTRMGFAEAARRLGGFPHHADAVRDTPDASSPERLEDLIRVVAGMTDLIVVRAAAPVAALQALSKVPVINGGDTEEHPTQALIDLFAIEQLCGPVSKLSVGLCGDLSMRAARSLLKLFALCPPARLRLIAPRGRLGDANRLAKPLGGIVEEGGPGEFDGLDALYMVGLPMRGTDEVLGPEIRKAYALNEGNISRLPASAQVFSPMPVIDEIDVELMRESSDRRL